MGHKPKEGEWVKVKGEEVRVTDPGEFVVQVQGENDRYPRPVRSDEVEAWQTRTD